MLRAMMKSKIHRATVTQADLNYVGSLTLCRTLMDAADLLPGERIDMVDVTNGSRLTTYVIEGPPGSGVVGINGAAAHLVIPGDLVIIISYGLYSAEEIAQLMPRVVFVDERNSITSVGKDSAQPVPGSGTVRGDIRYATDLGSTAVRPG